MFFILLITTWASGSIVVWLILSFGLAVVFGACYWVGLVILVLVFTDFGLFVLFVLVCSCVCWSVLFGVCCCLNLWSVTWDSAII